MNKISIAIAASVIGIAASGSVLAQSSTTTTTTTWSDTQGAQLNQAYTTSHYTVVTNPALSPDVGVVLPPTVTFYPLPETIAVPDRANYGYSVINGHPVVVEKTTRRVVRTWN